MLLYSPFSLSLTQKLSSATVFLPLLLSPSLRDPVSDYALSEGLLSTQFRWLVNAGLSVGQEFNLLAPNLVLIETFNETNTSQSISDFEQTMLTSSIAL